jgi:hypothetical protein
VFFDFLSAHGAFAPLAFQAQNMNLSPGGKQSILQDTIIPSDDPNIPAELCGKPQTMYLLADPSNPDAGPCTKGIQVILQEQGLWHFYKKRQAKLKLPPLQLKCPTCCLSAQNQDASKQTALLMEEAHKQVFFLTEDQAFASINNAEPKSHGHQDQDSTSCCWLKIMLLQSDFLNKKPLL